MLSKRNSRTFKHLDQKGAIFQGFQGLEKTVMNFKYFQAFSRTCTNPANLIELNDGTAMHSCIDSLII